MKLIAFADIHGSVKIINDIINKAKREKADFIICAGDISLFSGNLNKSFSKLKCGIPVIVIPGNHEDEAELKQLCRKFGFLYLHNGYYRIGNYLFIGHGGGGFSLRDEDFENIAKKIKKIIKRNDKVVLITHAPPYGTKLDSLPMGYVGCKSFTKFIKEAKPILHISGHLHETAGITDKIGNTKLINVSLKGRIIEI
mgnify:CR=1 FL=1